jgi:hypothetical protein
MVETSNINLEKFIITRHELGLDRPEENFIFENNLEFFLTICDHLFFFFNTNRSLILFNSNTSVKLHFFFDSDGSDD